MSGNPTTFLFMMKPEFMAVVHRTGRSFASSLETVLKSSARLFRSLFVIALEMALSTAPFL